jgi:hypothetical protein
MRRELNAVGNTIATGAGDHPLDLFKFSAAGARGSLEQMRVISRSTRD